MSTSKAAAWAPYRQLCTPLSNTQPPADERSRARTLFNTDILFASASGKQRTMNLLPGLAHVQCPVLVMAGDRSFVID